MSLTIRSTGHGLIASPAKPQKKVTFGDWLPVALLLCAIVGLTLLATSDYVWMVL